MITEQEILKGEKCPDEYKKNLSELLEKINKLRTLWGKPMQITSGFRTMAHHIKVYKDKGITDLSKIPMQSNHLYGRALDIQDKNGELREWILKNIKHIKSIGLYIEDFRYTKGWVHFQINPPTSKKLIFIPYLGKCPNPEIWDGKYEE